VSQATLLALSKYEDKKARGKVKAGEYDIDALVRIVGSMVVREDYTQSISAAVPWQKLACVLFSKLNGVTLESVLREALDADLDTEAMTNAAKVAVAKIVERTTQPCKGRVELKVEAQLVDFDEEH
jgi:hypothetical protein